MKKYILFDHDGVLVDTEYYYFKANQKAMAELGIHLEKSVYLELMSEGLSCWEFVPDPKMDELAIDRKRLARNAYYQEFLKNEDINIPGVEEVLRVLSQTYRMAIITTSKRNDFEIIHRNRNIVSYMDFVLTLEDYEHTKPHPDPYLRGVERLGAKKCECLVVEDSARGLKSAVSAGLDCVIVHNEFTKSHDFSKATHRIGSLRELPQLLDGLDTRADGG